jgi:DNA invertase Pin-like site-specific DNA recombinase
MKTAVIYARVSSVGDRQNTDRQVIDLTKYSKENGYSVVKTFTEHISGAKKNEERKVLCDCMAYCLTNSVDVLLVSELSRLGRDPYEVMDTIKICVQRKLNVFFLNDGISVFLPDGSENPIIPIYAACVAWVGKMERQAIQYRLESGRSAYIEKGGKLGRKEGYRKPKDDKQKEYKSVIDLLTAAKQLRDAGQKVPDTLQIREIAKTCSVGVSTVQRLKKEFNL